MPTTAQDRASRGPFAALLILLSLFLASGNAAAGQDFRSSARLGPSRPGAASAIVPAGTRYSLDDELPGAGAGSSVLPSAPDIVTGRLRTRPLAEGPSRLWAAIPRPAGASYRARAPPAS